MGRVDTGGNRFPFSNFKSFALSFQSSLHLSLPVLFCFRFLSDFLLLMEFTTRFEMHSQAI